MPRRHAGLPPTVGHIFVLAGCNGAGKSSIGGQALHAAGVPYFNPDLAAREAMEHSNAHGRSMTQHEANAWAWQQGVAGLRRAIAERGNYALETTLGGETIVDLLLDAANAGVAVNVWFVGLASVELHVARVRQRVARGGHDIPRADIERRFDRGRINLIRLLPRLRQLRVYDNSVQADADQPANARPRLQLHMVGGRIVGPPDLAGTAEWAKPIVAAALRVDAASNR